MYVGGLYMCRAIHIIDAMPGATRTAEYGCVLHNGLLMVVLGVPTCFYGFGNL